MKKFGDPARLALLLASVCATPFAFASPAMAQDEASVETSDEVIVTARRREESLQDVPIAITVQTAEQLDQRGAENITVLQQTVPNATIQVARGSNSTLIAFIRGVGQQDPLWGFEPGVGLYVDDVYIARPQAAVLDIFDIERIEVLRGPQGTLYGRNTVGGAVRYVTRLMDTEEAHLRARVQYGSYNQLDGIISGSLPLTENFVVGGALALYSRDGFGENQVTGAEHYNKDVDAFRLSAQWTPTDALTIRLTADGVDDDSNPRHGSRLASFPAGGPSYDPQDSVYDTRAGSGDDNHVETRGSALHIDYEISPNLTVRSITAQREGRTNGTIDFDNTEFPTLDIPAFYSDEQFTQEFQLLFDYDRIQGVAGLYYLDALAEGAFDTVLGGLATTIFTQGSVDTESLAAFADVSFDITESLALSVGGRWTRDEKTGQVYRQNFTGIRSPFFGNGAAIPGLVRTNYTNSAEFEEFTPRVSVTWEPSDELTLYTSYSQGFKSGGFDMRGDAVFTPDTVNGYAPEFVDTYEIGFHSSFWQGRFNLSGAVFQSEYTDMQITRQEPTTLGGIASFVDNAASAEIRGAELEGRLFLSDNLSANFAVGYIDGSFNEYISNTVVANPAPPPATIVVPIDLSGSAALQNTPDITASASFTYTAALAGGQLAITPSASYRGDSQMFEFASASLDQGAYTLYNASITWTSEGDRLRLGLHGQNLGDEEYRVGGYNFPGATFGNSIIGFYGPPQTVTASLEVRF
ncbi:MAG: TonB-dependent receptor [Phycisphaerales bacterium]|nr:TonB-dependent receptor [Hyphomonadaceae bacterium]